MDRMTAAVEMDVPAGPETHLLQCRSVSLSLRGTCSRAVDVVAHFSSVISTAQDDRQHGRTTGGMAAPDAWKTLPTVPFGSVRIT